MELETKEREERGQGPEGSLNAAGMASQTEG